ncbi:hypothetical protein POX_e06503 [Penicillium oxalicum]|uniref:hypothetical protein n=1 Tax=Penicillium oxalicum TaxID=69781 RepID=UPI0020B72A92|nr:hypothetical protein POX_e06503 [Penicillium oxalicum]KAI2788487.1 hypothetical protein POX_e06503 [Penicillium oxalicum]
MLSYLIHRAIVAYLRFPNLSTKVSSGIHHDDGSRFNEVDRLKERYVEFRPSELQRVAGEVMQQDEYPDIAKLAEGGFNKVFILRAKNGREILSRIPTSIAGPPHCTTASEVATMDFLRHVLKLPVPKIFDYST